MSPIQWIESLSFWPMLLVLVIIPTTFATVGPLLVRRLISLEDLERNNEVAGFKFGVLGTIYAVLLAFIVFVVWQNFTNAGSDVEHEASELGDLDHITSAMGPASAVLHDDIRNYIVLVVDKEWKSMETGQRSPEAQAAYEKIWNALLPYKPKDFQQQCLYTSALSTASSFSDARRQRLTDSQSAVPSLLWAVLILGGIAVTSFAWFFGSTNLSAQMLMSGILGGMIALVLFLIFDLDGRFTGDEQVDPSAFRELLQRLDYNHVHNPPPPPS